MSRQRPGERRCVCGHDKTLHAYPERRSDGLPARRSDGLGACSAFDYGCKCLRFVTPGQRRMSEWRKRHVEAVRVARLELSKAQARLSSQED
jgi:hypothetical protein